MVHVRHNEKEVKPNPSINFITCLPDEPTRQEEAYQLLRALAAQVKPLMKRHGFEVNSLEEYEYNAVFAGRNWNGGETIEIVLRQSNGAFYPAYWLMSTLCHELAHIKHMNHGAAFQALWSRLRTEVRQLQARGYYGDGFWSSGTRLRDLAQIGGDGVEFDDLPEYVCGGAQTRSRPTANRRRLHGGPRGKRREVIPSLHTGAQTGKKPRAGSRVTSKHAFKGEGIALDGGVTGIGFGKRAQSKRAREERAAAADRRLSVLLGKSEEQPKSAGTEDDGSATDSDGEVETIAETDADRRQALQDCEHPSGNLQKLCTKDWAIFRHELESPSSSTSRFTSKTESSSKATLLPALIDDDVIEIFSSSDEGTGCDIPQSSGSVFTTGNVHPSSLSRKGKGKEFVPMSRKSLGRETGFNDKEGSGIAVSVNHIDRNGEKMVTRRPSSSNGPSRLTTEKSGKMWNCLVCTLENQQDHLACSACGTPKGQQTWSGVLES